MTQEQVAGQMPIIRAGHLLVLTIWIQNVMTDLVILKEDKSIIESFSLLDSDKAEFAEKRIEYWQKSFPHIKKKFSELFPEYAEKYKDDIETLQHLRDFFAHARYSIKIPLIFYQPDTTRKDLEKKVTSLTDMPYAENQTLLKVEMTEENYNIFFASLMKFENVIFPEIAAELNVNLNRFK